MSVKQYRKKPVVIEAIQYNGENDYEVKNFCSNASVLYADDKIKLIETLEGNMEISVNDYIIKGVKGEFYPCKPDIFEMTYEVV